MTNKKTQTIVFNEFPSFDINRSFVEVAMAHTWRKQSTPSKVHKNVQGQAVSKYGIGARVVYSKALDKMVYIHRPNGQIANMKEVYEWQDADEKAFFELNASRMGYSKKVSLSEKIKRLIGFAS